jgi:hypothetical protein
VRRKYTAGGKAPITVAMRQPPPDSVKQEIERTTWLQFAALILLLCGALNIIAGLSMIGGSRYVADKLQFANLDAWGWFFLIWGIIQIVAGVAVLRGESWAVIVGIATSLVNAIAELASSKTFPVWSLSLIAGNVLAIYGLVRYGGTRRRTPARS